MSLPSRRPDQSVKRPLAPASERGASLLHAIGEVLIIVAAALALALLIQQFLVKPFVIPSDSMVPTLVRGDRVLVNRLTYRFGEPQRGDVVVFESPLSTDDYIKRVVAVGGDTVAVQGGRLYVNGVPQEELYLNDELMAGDFPQVTVPRDEYFVMGDNRNNSGDSRVFGPIAKGRILGKAFAIYWPPGRLRGL